MTIAIDTSRRRFLAGSAAAAGGLTLGFHIPFGAGREAAAQGATPEVNAWVVVKPDDSVVVRVARIDMGQGTVTGLVQLVAEELECDWAKVSYEYPTPGQNLARNRVWGNFQTAGSQGIRQSQEYVRKGGAAARMMLVQAAAQQWNVPVAECSVAKGVITHAASGRSTTYGKVVTPGNPGKSSLLTIVAGKDEDLPLPEKHKLPPKQLALVEKWIAQGAK